MASICLIGSGKLGARHLQALKNFREPHDIYVIEPADFAREEARKIYEATPGQDNSIYYVSSLDELSSIVSSLDVVIVATSSAPRRAIVEQLTNMFDVKAMILEKVLFQRIDDFDSVDSIIDKRGIHAWVNCPRRYFEVYQEIKDELKNAEQFQVNVSGSNWGLGCNGIHFIDLIAYLAGSSDVQINIGGLDDECIESKRKGYYEITGAISGNVGKCNDFSITSYCTGNIPNSVIITSDTSKHIVFEWAGKCLSVSAVNGLQEKEIRIPFQSQLTNIEVEDILYTGNCKLTSYKESVELHKALMVPLSKYFREKGFEEGFCPIT